MKNLSIFCFIFVTVLTLETVKLILLNFTVHYFFHGSLYFSQLNKQWSLMPKQAPDCIEMMNITTWEVWLHIKVFDFLHFTKSNHHKPGIHQKGKHYEESRNHEEGSQSAWVWQASWGRQPGTMGMADVMRKDARYHEDVSKHSERQQVSWGRQACHDEGIYSARIWPSGLCCVPQWSLKRKRMHDCSIWAFDTNWLENETENT